ncbi:MAG: hypothetical protein DMF38_07355 [Verrucomicrobia bacterium]|nr:MAG: hypothetical protein DMF38_07355 [Verrucomicrobiota bacterium]
MVGLSHVIKNRIDGLTQFIDDDQVASVRVRGILQCHARVNPNSLFKVRIETQSSVARGSTKRNEVKKD